MPIVRVDKTKRHRVQRAQDIAKAIAERDAQETAPAAPQPTSAPAPVVTDIPAAPAAFRKDTST